jgi:hypothetical protein
MRLLIFDGMSAVTAIDPDNYSAGLTVHHSKAVVTMANGVVRALLARSVGLLSGKQSADNEITQQESELLNPPCTGG